MGFLDELREKVNNPIKKETDPQLVSIANEYYREEVIDSVNLIKTSLRREVEAFIKSNQSSGKRTFLRSTLLKYHSQYKEIYNNVKIDYDSYNENNGFFTLGEQRLYTPHYHYIKLNPLYSVKTTPKTSWFIIPYSSQIARIDLTDIGQRFYDDIKLLCEEEGITITKLYAKNSWNDEFPLGQDCEVHGKSFEVWIDYKIDL